LFAKREPVERFNQFMLERLLQEAAAKRQKATLWTSIADDRRASKVLLDDLTRAPQRLPFAEGARGRMTKNDWDVDHIVQGGRPSAQHVPSPRRINTALAAGGPRGVHQRGRDWRATATPFRVRVRRARPHGVLGRSPPRFSRWPPPFQPPVAAP